MAGGRADLDVELNKTIISPRRDAGEAALAGDLEGSDAEQAITETVLISPRRTPGEERRPSLIEPTQRFQVEAQESAPPAGATVKRPGETRGSPFADEPLPATVILGAGEIAGEEPASLREAQELPAADRDAGSEPFR